MSPYVPGRIAEQLKNYRRYHLITQEQLAERLGCSKEAVQKWEQGRQQPGEMGRNAIMRLLQLELWPEEGGKK